MTATDSALVFPDWPLMGGTLVPPLTDVTSAHVLHRWVAALVGLFVLAVAIEARRTQRDHPTLVRLATWAAVLFGVQIVVGGLQVLTQLSAWTQTLHLALGAVIWALTGRPDRHELLHRPDRARPTRAVTRRRRPTDVARRRQPGPAVTRSAPTSR